ncbi:alpha-glucuronidase family glycosyl hydrolase [Paenibacillus vulneris]
MIDNGYSAWLRYEEITNKEIRKTDLQWLKQLIIPAEAGEGPLQAAVQELAEAIGSISGEALQVTERIPGSGRFLAIGVYGGSALVNAAVSQDETENVSDECYWIRTVRSADASYEYVVLAGLSEKGALYAAFHFIRLLQTGERFDALDIREAPVNRLRMLNHWDNIDGSIERGYSGRSIFFNNDAVLSDSGRIRDYARLAASVGINAVAINNVNVHRQETFLITETYLPDVARVAEVFRRYGIKLYLSVNYAGPMELGELDTADPIDPVVADWWKAKAKDVYRHIPDFGGFLVKADSENRPGPFTYGRDHADGANMLGEALRPYGGLVLWRCFVYNCHQDWRDRSTDRARAAYDHFKPLDGRFADNVILQIKNGPMDFQVREPVSPLFGAMEQTNQLMEFQITQEYTGQQKHVCYLIPQWKEILDFDTCIQGEGSSVKAIAAGCVHPYRYSGITAVANIGDDENWTGHHLAQANLYGFGRLAWNPDLSAQAIAEEWTKLTFGQDPEVLKTVVGFLMASWPIYESYTSPLGVGWMVTPHYHYGPDVDGYEYSKWGTYHFADRDGIGVDRTQATGTGYTKQYAKPNEELYDRLDTCPDELLLFFHHVPYTYKLHSGKTVIQHIYDTHFEGVEQVERWKAEWLKLEGKIDESRFDHIRRRIETQLESARQWRDVINTYFYRKSGIPDELHRKIY